MALKHLFLVTAVAASTFLSSTLPTIAVNPPLRTGMDVKEMTNVEVNGVKIENFAGKVIIHSMGTNKAVRVRLKGSDDLLKQVLVEDNHGKDNGNLYIAFEKNAPLLKDLDTLTLTLEMPAKMPLDLTLVGGNGHVGPREANETKININGFGDIKLASAQNFQSTIDGSGEITVMNVNGDASLVIRGDGKYVIQKGSIPQLKATIQGTGEIVVKASVKDADLKSEGAGTMNLATVTGKLSQSVSGAGTINIAKVSPPVAEPEHFDMNCARIPEKK